MEGRKSWTRQQESTVKQVREARPCHSLWCVFSYRHSPAVAGLLYSTSRALAAKLSLIQVPKAWSLIIFNPDHFQSPLGLNLLQLSLWWAALWLNFFTCFFFSAWSPGLERSQIHHTGSGTFGLQIVSGWIKCRSLKAWAYLGHMGRWISSDISRAFWADCVCSINMAPSGHGHESWSAQT